MLDQDAEIMIIGSGLSDLGAYLYEQGFQCITNIDVSSVAIKFMSQKHQKLDEMEYAQMDITDLEIPTQAGSFQLVLDKGTLDSLTCCESDKKIEMMLANIYKMLASGGHFICVSRGAPETRMGFLQDKR